MGSKHSRQVAILYAGDRETRDTATPEKTRFVKLFAELKRVGVRAECAVYHDDFCDEVRRQLAEMDGVLVWVNPIEGGRSRSMLDAMLREVSASGVFVSAHPDTILKMGTKDVLYRTRDMSWGSDTHVYHSPAELRTGLTRRLAAGETRVLKQHRGNGGNGVWKVEAAHGDTATNMSSDAMLVRVRHAKRGSVDETLALKEFVARCGVYFADDGMIIDQEYVPRLPEGMIRCYMVHDKVAGFGHQAINALCPLPPGAPADATPQVTPRIYHPPSLPLFQPLRQRLEQEWVAEMQGLLGIRGHELPILWDCDFLLGPKVAAAEDSYVLCEINVSSVAPYPDSAVPEIARATLESLQ